MLHCQFFILLFPIFIFLIFHSFYSYYFYLFELHFYLFGLQALCEPSHQLSYIFNLGSIIYFFKDLGHMILFVTNGYSAALFIPTLIFWIIFLLLLLFLIGLQVFCDFRVSLAIFLVNPSSELHFQGPRIVAAIFLWSTITVLPWTRSDPGPIIFLPSTAPWLGSQFGLLNFEV